LPPRHHFPQSRRRAAIRAAQAVGISNPRIEIDRNGTITIVLGEPPKDNGAAAPDTPESIIEQL
jgi:hypothetical protein